MEHLNLKYLPDIGSLDIHIVMYYTIIVIYNNSYETMY